MSKYKKNIYFLFKYDENATIAAQKSQGENMIIVRNIQKWFSRFLDGNFEAEDAPRSR